MLIVIAAPSGTGKSTLVKALRAAHPALGFSVSHTTRKPRPGEVDGVDYHFVDRATFEASIEAQGFVEWAEYAGNLYGTALSTIEAAQARGEDLILEVEVQGAGNLKKAVPKAVSIFIVPPGWAELERRLRSRGTEAEAVIQRRLDTAREEIKAADTFDYIVLNDDKDDALKELQSIYRSEGLRPGARRALLDRLRSSGRE